MEVINRQEELKKLFSNILQKVKGNSQIDKFTIKFSEIDETQE